MFEHSIDVSDGDIDSLGHVSNIAYVRWIQDVAVAHSTSLGLDVPAYKRMGAIFVIRRHEIDYVRPVLRSDRVQARTWIDTLMAAKCVRMTELRRGDGEIVAQARTTWGFVDLARGRPTRIPAEVRGALGFPRGEPAREPLREASGDSRQALGANPDVEIVERAVSRAE
jgi:acyl-CoA thioester hydrolase